MTSLPPIGSLVLVQARGMVSPYIALVTGHPGPLGRAPVVELVSSSFGGAPYRVFLECVQEVPGDSQ